MLFLCTVAPLRKTKLPLAANDTLEVIDRRDIPGFQDQYWACAGGHIYSSKGRLTGHFHRKGYHRVTLRVDRRNKNFYTHRLVALAFHGECPDGYHVDHIDFDRINNRPENLRYLSAEENSLRTRRSVGKGGAA